MSVNLFQNACYRTDGKLRKHSPLKVKTLQKYGDSCEKMLWRCDEMKLISPNDLLLCCPCFSNVANDTNSNSISIPLETFSCNCFTGVSVVLSSNPLCNKYSVFVVYEGQTYNLIDFKFYTELNRKVQQNGYMSDCIIHGKAYRLQVVSGGEFNIGDFIVELLSFSNANSERALENFGMYYITRFDFCIDFFHKNEIKHLGYDDVFNSLSRKTGENIVKDRMTKKIYTGWTCGNRKDKYIYTRMYQKQVQALDSGDGDLYSDYVNYNGKVWRLEFEFLSKFTTVREHISFFDEWSQHTMTKQVFEYLGVNEKQGYFSKPTNKLVVPFNQLSLSKKKSIKTSIEHTSLTLMRSGINVFSLIGDYLRTQGFDSQIIESCLDEACETLYFHGESDWNDRFNKSSITTKELYDKIYLAQLGVDL